MIELLEYILKKIDFYILFHTSQRGSKGRFGKSNCSFAIKRYDKRYDKRFDKVFFPNSLTDLCIPRFLPKLNKDIFSETNPWHFYK